MAQLWRCWHRQWHSSVLAVLRSTRSSVEAVAERRQPALSRVYGWIIDRKRRRELSHAQRIAPPHVPVLSVGNITFGATGKTPFVQFLIDYVLKRATGGDVPLMLSRGYGDDEWRMLAKQFPTCHLALGGDRVAIGTAKVKELGGEQASLSCVVLDDGLQQWRLAKDLEIVMVDALHPLGNGLLLPLGSLRELPRDALARADIVIVHHANLLDGEELKKLMECLRMLMNWQRSPVIATSQMKVKGLIPAGGLLSSSNRDSMLKNISSLDGRLALVVCGVGNPDSVAKVVGKLVCWVRVELKAFPDHHAFNSGDVQDILDWVHELQRNEDVVVVTTEKDFARSSQVMEALAQEVDLRILKCELELLHNADLVENRVNSYLDRTTLDLHS